MRHGGLFEQRTGVMTKIILGIDPGAAQASEQSGETS
jgi:hypothetical protein